MTCALKKYEAGWRGCSEGAILEGIEKTNLFDKEITQIFKRRLFEAEGMVSRSLWSWSVFGVLEIWKVSEARPGRRGSRSKVQDMAEASLTMAL